MSIETINLIGGAVVYLDITRTGVCRKCKMPIFWAITKKSKNMPICKDKDGKWVSHFSNCPQADEFRIGRMDNLEETIRQKERDDWKNK